MFYALTKEEIVEYVEELIKRKLSEVEYEAIKKIFGNSIEWSEVLEEAVDIVIPIWFLSV